LTCQPGSGPTRDRVSRLDGRITLILGEKAGSRSFVRPDLEAIVQQDVPQGRLAGTILAGSVYDN
jgi:hypothetical protein